MSNRVWETNIPGLFRVNDKSWIVGERYKLHCFLGAGAYGEVVKATDRYLQKYIALKKVSDILLNSLLAKRVLREVCIMRRLTHPYILTWAIYAILKDLSLLVMLNCSCGSCFWGSITCIHAGCGIEI
ncbi:hypothetical protein L7F22_002131 [Adiantum nelumboides]|nr:hypothetical protein [Adiantum nelumboides]